MSRIRILIRWLKTIKTKRLFTSLSGKTYINYASMMVWPRRAEGDFKFINSKRLLSARLSWSHGHLCRNCNIVIHLDRKRTHFLSNCPKNCTLRKNCATHTHNLQHLPASSVCKPLGMIVSIGWQTAAALDSEKIEWFRIHNLRKNVPIASPCLAAYIQAV